MRRATGPIVSARTPRVKQSAEIRAQGIGVDKPLAMK
jgi:hypothetical protein